jgi:hypothetical protein
VPHLEAFSQAGLGVELAGRIEVYLLSYQTEGAPLPIDYWSRNRWLHRLDQCSES